MPARTEPVTDTIAGVGCSTRARPVSRSPQTTLKTPGGQDLGHQLGHQQRRGRRRVAGLEHHRVARGERRCPLPHRHHHRVVPRRHGARTRRSARGARNSSCPAMYSVAPRPSRSARGAGEETNLVDHRRDLLAHRDRDDLAAVLGLDGDELLGVRLEDVGDLAAARAALRRRRAPPRRERLRRRPATAASTSAASETGISAKGSPVAGIDQLDVLPALGSDRLAPDEIRQTTHDCPSDAATAPATSQPLCQSFPEPVQPTTKDIRTLN